MPNSEEKRRGLKGYRTIHPPGRPDVYIHVGIVKEKGARGGTTVAGKPKHKKMYA